MTIKSGKIIASRKIIHGLVSKVKRIAAFFQPPWLYLIISFIAFFPCLILGQAYFDGDLFTLFSIYRTLLKSALIHGCLPLWNPYVFAGQPFFADPNTSSAYPFLYPFLPFSLSLGFGLFYFLHLFLAMAGMHYWLKLLGLSRGACALGSLTFAFSGMFWCDIAHTPVFTAFAWLPWFLGFLEKYSRTNSPFPAGASGAVLALLFLAGSPWVFLGVCCLGPAYFLFRVGWGGKGTNLFIFIPYFIWGLLPMILLALPFADFMRFSDRVTGALGYESYSGYSMNPSDLYRLLFPLRPIDPALNLLRPEPASFTAEGFLGLWTPFLALTAFRFKENRILKIFLVALAAFSLLVGFGKYFPLHPWLFRHIPGFDLLRGPFHFRFIYQTAVCVLAAMGFDSLSKIRPPKSLFQGSWPWITAYLVGTTLGALAFEWREDFLLILALFAGIGLGLLSRKELARRAGRWLFGFSLAVSLVLGGWNFSTSRWGPSSNLDFAKDASLFSALHGKCGLRRFFLGDNIPFPAESGGENIILTLPANASCFFYMKNAGGSNALSLSARGELFTTSFKTFQRLMAIQGFATGNEKGTVPGFDRETLGPIKLYTSRELHPMVYAPKRWETVLDRSLRLSRMPKCGLQPL